jgi:hypothetical protein
VCLSQQQQGRVPHTESSASSSAPLISSITPSTASPSTTTAAVVAEAPAEATKEAAPPTERKNVLELAHSAAAKLEAKQVRACVSRVPLSSPQHHGSPLAVTCLT